MPGSFFHFNLMHIYPNNKIFFYYYSIKCKLLEASSSAYNGKMGFQSKKKIHFIRKCALSLKLISLLV